MWFYRQRITAFYKLNGTQKTIENITGFVKDFILIDFNTCILVCAPTL